MLISTMTSKSMLFLPPKEARRKVRQSHGGAVKNNLMFMWNVNKHFWAKVNGASPWSLWNAPNSFFIKIRQNQHFFIKIINQHNTFEFLNSAVLKILIFTTSRYFFFQIKVTKIFTRHYLMPPINFNHLMEKTQLVFPCR